MYRFFDTHTHIDFLLLEPSQSLALLIESCYQKNVFKIAIMGIYRFQFEQLKKLGESNQEFFCWGLGLHPLYLEKHQPEDLDFIQQFLYQRPNNCTFIGEIGLDRHVKEFITKEKWRLQCEYFEAQLDLAQSFNLPVSIHARHCHADIYAFLKKKKIKGVIHGFSGSYEEAKRYIELGLKIGVGGTITYPRAIKTRTAISKLPIDSFVLETDTPDMPIFGQQGKPNHPANIPIIFNCLQNLLNVPKANLAEQIWETSLAVFH